MATTTPKRTEIEQAMATALETIATGYYRTDPVLVTRALKPIDQYRTELGTGPILGVMRGSGSTLDRDSHDAITPDMQRHRVAVWGYVLGTSKEGDGDLAGELLNNLWQDHLEALLADPTLGGVAYQCVPDGPMDTDDGAREPLAFFRQHWLVEASA